MYIEKLIENFIVEETDELINYWLSNNTVSDSKLEKDIYDELLLTAEDTFGDDLSYLVQDDIVKRIIKNSKRIAKKYLN